MNEHVVVIASLVSNEFSRTKENFPDLRQWNKHCLNIAAIAFVAPEKFRSETKEQKTIKTAIIVKLQ